MLLARARRRPLAVRLRGDRAARAARAAPLRRAWSGSTRRRSARRPRSSRTASTRRSVLDALARASAASTVPRRVRAVRGRRRARSGRRVAAPDVDVVSVGADPHRDFELLLAVARTLPDVELPRRHDGRSRTLARRPADATSRSRPTCRSTRCADRLERARVVALPVRDNSYSGATTVLLQAMALAKPVVVTRTAAIATGYGLEDGDNVRLVAPGDGAAFGSALAELLATTSTRARSARGRARPSKRSSRGSATSSGWRPFRRRSRDRATSTVRCLSRSTCLPAAGVRGRR